ncbi:MAG: hypothetical protein HN590_07540 [Calditrichaeota bacterium]|nr:hypothetical protein [Calditrichota bacterium]
MWIKMVDNMEYSELEAEIIRIGERSRSTFLEIAYQGVENSQLKAGIDHVLSYWQDGIRPALIQFSYDAVCSKPLDIDPVALFFSISGAGIGVHDDIIDETAEKHHRHTVPGLFGRDAAITVGDLLIVKGLTSIREILKDVDSEIVYLVLEEYERFFTEMCVGEMMEIRARRRLDLSLEDYHEMLWKLGVDTEACCVMGAILGGGTDNEVQCLASYGRTLGYLNRLHDEVSDMFGSNEDFRRRIQKESIPLLLLYSAQTSDFNYQRISEIITKSELKQEDLNALLVISVVFDSLDYLIGLAANAKDEAINSINSIQPMSKRKLELIVLNLFNEIEKKCSRFTT